MFNWITDYFKKRREKEEREHKARMDRLRGVGWREDQFISLDPPKTKKKYPKGISIAKLPDDK